MFDINRLDLTIMQVLYSGDASSCTTGMTISEIMDDLFDVGIERSRWSIYRRLNGLVENGYVAKGILENHADTFYLLTKSKQIIGGNQNELER